VNVTIVPEEVATPAGEEAVSQSGTEIEYFTLPLELSV
jgi:hypothetical protein